MSTIDDDSTLDGPPQKLLRWWGMLFRFFLIAVIGLASWVFLYQPGIEDIPIGQLTLKQIGGRIFSALIALGCILWFFKFPDEDKLDGLSYQDWGKLGGWVFLAAGGGVAIWLAFTER